MPLYYFDIVDGGLTLDTEGTEFPNARTARDEAIRALPDIARDKIGTGQSQEVLVLMRGEDGRALFVASLSLAAKWLVEDV